MLLWIDPLNHLLARLEMRALLAFCTSFTIAFVLAVPVIRWLRQNEFGEQTEKTPIEDEQLRNQIAAKSGTPTMGGIIIAIATLLTCLVWGNFGSLSFWLLIGVYLALGSMGFIDDWMKMQATAHRERGLKVRHKLILQGFIGAVAGYIWYRFGNPNIASSLPWPTFGWLIGAGGAILAAIWVALAVATMSNAVNVTDGLDGLAGGLALAAFLPFILLACQTVSPADSGAEAIIFCGALAGGVAGFLCFNWHPAKVFMGDTGSLAIGGSFGLAAVLLHAEILLPLFAFLFLVEFSSSVLQVLWFKATGRRILPIAPLHHIFQKKGWPEKRIVLRFCFVGGLLAAVPILL